MKMSIRKFVLSGIVAFFVVAIAGAFLLAWLDARNELALQAEIEELVQAYDDAIYLDRDYKAAIKAANGILMLASKANDPQAVEARGLIRLPFAAIASGKWTNGWKRQVKDCANLVTDKPTLARAEFLLYSGLIKGKWEHKFEEGLKQTQEAVWIANQVKDDRALALALLHSCELYGFLNQANLVARNSYRGVNVAEHLGRKSILAKALNNLILNLVYLEKYPEAGTAGKRLLEILPDSSSAMYAMFLANKEDNQYEKYVVAKLKEYKNRTEKKPLGNKEAAKFGQLLKRLGICYLIQKDFAKCREFMELAIPKLAACNNKSSLATCKDALQLAQLELADDVSKIDEVAENFDANAKFPQIVFAKSLGDAYANLDEKEKSCYWKEFAWKLREKDNAVELGYLQQSSELYWESELRARQQTLVNNRIEADSSRRSWLLSLALALCALLGGFYFMVRKERNSLEDIVKNRTMSLSKAIEDANAADQAKSDFLAQINHEIRNPLTAILSYCDLLSSQKGQSSHLVKGIESSSLHLRGLVDKILEVSKIESNGLESSPTEFFPEQTANDINGIMTELATKKGLKFECIFNGDHSYSVLSDETKIRQIAINLIGNAIKFTEEGSVIVSFELKDQKDFSDTQLVITVKDTGIGIAENETAAVLDRFTKASNTAACEGSGLGLFITTQLVNCLGGEMTLSSELGVGTQVNVTLPLKVVKRPRAFEKPVSTNNEAIKVEDALEAAAKAASLTKRDKRVLIVDDQEMIRTTLKLQLNACGLECETSQELEEAIELFGSWQPDLVLLDLRMPKFSGFDVLRRIRDSKKWRTPVYAMTGDATAKVQEKCLSHGFDGFVTKPFRISTILDILEGKQGSGQFQKTSS